MFASLTEEGESHFDDIDMPMCAVQYAPPAPALHLSTPIAATQVSWLRFPADWNDAAHPCRGDSSLSCLPAKSKVGRAAVTDEDSRRATVCSWRTPAEEGMAHDPSMAKLRRW